MKIIAQKEDLVKALGKVDKAVSTRTTIPILTGIKVVADDKGVTLTGSDSDISIECTIPLVKEDKELVKVERPGSIVLNAKFFTEIIKKVPEDTIEIEVSDQFSTTIKSGKAVFNLNGFDPEEYPKLPVVESETILKITSDTLKSIVRETAFAVSTAETRPILTGVNWVYEQNGLTCTGTDSHRLAQKQIEVGDSSDLSFSSVIPAKSLSELNKILEDNEEIDMVMTDNQLCVKVENLVFYSRLLDGMYPVTKNMIPTTFKTEIILDPKALLQSLERGLLLSQTSKNNVVTLKTIEGGLEGSSIEITAITPEIGKVVEIIPCSSVEGEDIQVAFNGKNLIDALKVISAKEVKISLTGPMSPFLIKPMDNEKVVHLFSPVRTY